LFNYYTTVIDQSIHQHNIAIQLGNVFPFNSYTNLA